MYDWQHSVELAFHVSVSMRIRRVGVRFRSVWGEEDCYLALLQAVEVKMFFQLGLLGCFVLVPFAAGTQQLVAFDAASASSTYSAGNLAGSPAFAAQQALSGGSGYWFYILASSICGTIPCRRLEGVPAAAMLLGRV